MLSPIVMVLYKALLHSNMTNFTEKLVIRSRVFFVSVLIRFEQGFKIRKFEDKVCYTADCDFYIEPLRESTRAFLTS